MSTTYRMLVSSLATTTCLPSGLNHATSGSLKDCPAARSPARGNCHRLRPLGSMISTRLPSPSAINTGPGSTEGSEPGASQPGPEAVSAMGPLAVVGVVAVGCCVVAVAAWVAPGGQCEDIPPALAGAFGVAPAVMSHQDPKPRPTTSAASSPRTSRQCFRSSGDGARRCCPLTVFLQLEHGPG